MVEQHLVDSAAGTRDTAAHHESLSSTPWPRGPRTTARRPSWRRAYLLAAIVWDLAGVWLGASLAGVVGSRSKSAYVLGTSVRMPYLLVTLILSGAWLLTLTMSRVYNVRVFGSGNEEYRRIFDAAIRLALGVAAIAFLAHLNLSRSYVLVVAPFMLLWSLTTHWLGRQHLHHRRRHGECREGAVVVGSPKHVVDLVRHLHHFPYVGFEVVGACTGTGTDAVDVDGSEVPVVAAPADLVAWIRQGRTRSVMVADATVLGPGALRQFAWQLEGLGVDLIVAPSVTGVAGPRISVRPVEGLPLLHLEEPRFDGVTRLVKGAIERAAACVLLVALSPLLLIGAVLVKLTSPGPILFRSPRVGREGQAFEMLKLRTMVDGAHLMRPSLQSMNEHGDDPLFKMRDDPRVTRVGRWLRRLSIDELPQLAHVATGKMSVVGPRPPTPDEVSRYTDDAWRRLLVRPGITGLWQVSGRSSLPWLETLRLDLYYVDNWSLAMDLVIIIKTFSAVVRGSGAY